MMFKSVFLFLSLLVFVVHAKKRKCTCDGVDYSIAIPIFDNDSVKNIQINQLELPRDFREQFRQTLESYAGSYQIILQEMRDQHVDQQYITYIEAAWNEVMERYKKLGSLKDEDSYRRGMAEFSNYLMDLIYQFSQYTEAITDENVRYYYYTLMLSMVSFRSFISTSIDNSRCIYHNGGQVGGNPGGSNSQEHHGGANSHEHKGGSNSNEHKEGSNSNEHKGGSNSNEHKGESNSNEHKDGKGGENDRGDAGYWNAWVQ